MSTQHLRKFIESNPDWLVRLEQDYHIDINEYDGFVTLNYNQINSPRKHPIADQCRGVTVHKDTGTIVRQMFNRFYNYGEHPEVQEDFFKHSPVIQYNKEDGSIIGVWFNCITNDWEVGTRSVANGNNPIISLLREETSITFKSLFEEVWQKKDYGMLNPNFTYIFELCSLVNRVVTPYESKPSLYLLSAFNNLTGEEVSFQPLNKYWLLPAYVKFPEVNVVTSFEEVLDNLKKLPDLSEGFVLRNSLNQRLKLKTPKYLAAHRMTSNGLCPLDAIKLLIQNEHHEFLAYFPEAEPAFNKFSKLLEDFKVELDNFITQTKSWSDKEIGLKFKGNAYSPCIFQARKFKWTADQVLADLSDTQLKRWFIK